MSAFAVDVGLSVIKNITDLFRSARSDSLISYTKPMRVEPITLIDTDCLYVEGIHDLMMVLQNIFSGYYMQAVSISTNVGSISVLRQLDKLNPSRDPVDSATNSLGWLVATEHYQGLPNPTKKTQRMGLEAIIPYGEGAPDVGVNTTRDTVKELNELSNLAVGKSLSLEITDGEKKANVVVNVRLIPSSLPSKSLVHILSKPSENTTVKERLIAWKSGRLSTIKDMILVKDLIGEHRRKLMEDSDNKFASILRRKRNNAISTVLTANPSVATVSNIVVMSANTAEALEAENNIRLKHFSDRQELMDQTAIMLLVVVDERLDRVIIYHSTIPDATDVSFRDLKSSAKGAGPDVSEILKAYKMGVQPSL